MAASLVIAEDLSINELWDEAEENFQRLCGANLRTHHSDSIKVMVSRMHDANDQGSVNDGTNLFVSVALVASIVQDLSDLITVGMVVSPRELCTSATKFLIEFLSKSNKPPCDARTLFDAIREHLAAIRKFRSRNDLKHDIELPDVLQRSISLVLIHFIDICGTISGLALGKRAARVKVAMLNVISVDTSSLAGILQPFGGLIDKHAALERSLTSDDWSPATTKLEAICEDEILAIGSQQQPINRVRPVENVQGGTRIEGATLEQLAELREALGLPRSLIQEQEQTVQALSEDAFKNSGADLHKNASFLSWMDLASDIRPSLFISGRPSSGKSRLMYATLESLRSGELAMVTNNSSGNHVIVAYHFFQREKEEPIIGRDGDNESNYGSLDVVFKHLCFQIAQQDARHVEDLLNYMKVCDPPTTTLAELWVNLQIGRPKDGVVHILLIDGLDQGSIEMWETFLSIVNEHQRSKDKVWRPSPNWSSLRMLISCPPESLHYDILLDTPVVTINDVNTSNIKYFIEQKIAEQPLWAQDTAYMKNVVEMIRELLPTSSVGQFETVAKALDHVQKAAETQKDLETVRSILLNACEQDTRKIVERTLAELEQNLSNEDIKELQNILMWILHGRLTFTSEQLKIMSSVVWAEVDTKSYENILKSKFGAILDFEDVVLVKEPFEAYFLETEVERTETPQVASGKTAILKIKLNDTNASNGTTFSLNLDEQTDLERSNASNSGVTVDRPVIPMGRIDSKVRITVQLLELLRKKRTVVDEPMIIHAFLCINDYLREVFNQVLNGWLEPEELKSILSGLVRLLSDTEPFEWHILSQLNLHRHWLLDEPGSSEHIVHRWLTYWRAVSLLDAADRRRLDNLRKGEPGRLGFYRPLTRVMAKQWLQSAKGRPENYYRWVATFMKIEEAGGSRSAMPGNPKNLSTAGRRRVLAKQDGVENYLTLQDAVQWAQDNMPDLEQNELFFERLGQTCWCLGLDTETVRIYEAGKRRFSTHWLLYANNAIAWRSLNQITSAIEEMKEGLRLIREKAVIPLKEVPYYVPHVHRLIDWCVTNDRHEEAIRESNAMLALNPFDYDVHVMLLKAIQGSANPTYSKNHLNALLSEPGQDGESTKLIGLLKVAVDDFRLLVNVVVLSQIVTTARDAEVSPNILEAIDELSQVQIMKDDPLNRAICLLFKGFVLTSMSTTPNLEVLGDIIVAMKQLVSDLKAEKHHKETERLRPRIIIPAYAILATACFQRLRMSMKSCDDTEKDVKELEDMSELLPSGLPHAITLLANYYILLGQKEKARKLLTPRLKEHLDKLEDLADDDSTVMLGVALVLGQFHDEYNALTAWSLVTPVDADSSTYQEVVEYEIRTSGEWVAVKKRDGSVTGSDTPVQKGERAASEIIEGSVDVKSQHDHVETNDEQPPQMNSGEQPNNQSDSTAISNGYARDSGADIEVSEDVKDGEHGVKKDGFDTPETTELAPAEVPSQVIDVASRKELEDRILGNSNYWVRAKRIHLSPIVLNRHGIPWGFDENNDDFVITKTNIGEVRLRQFFAETEQLIDRSTETAVIQCNNNCGTVWMYASDIYVCKFCPATFLCQACLERAKAGKLDNIQLRCLPDHEWLHVPRWSNKRYEEVGEGNVRMEGEIGEDGSITGGRIVSIREWLDSVRKEWGLPAVPPRRRRRREVRIVRSNSSGSLSDD